MSGDSWTIRRWVDNQIGVELTETLLAWLGEPAGKFKSENLQNDTDPLERINALAASKLNR